jgi:hypothetical protein
VEVVVEEEEDAAEWLSSSAVQLERSSLLICMTRPNSVTAVMGVVVGLLLLAFIIAFIAVAPKVKVSKPSIFVIDNASTKTTVLIYIKLQ